jgi:predicted nuclease of predicted toxin-antitoxin system
MIKFLVDLGVGRKVEEHLTKGGYDVVSVRDVDVRAKDRDILKRAVSEGRMIMTMDKDFGELVHHSGMAHSGVLILRIEDATGKEKAEIVNKILTGFSDKIKNRFCVFQDGKLRVKE